MKFGFTIHFQSVLLTLVAVFLAMVGGRTMYGMQFGAAQPLVQWIPNKSGSKKDASTAQKKEALTSTENVMDPYYGN
tara:strand:+ start:455 stop:685 length:231 start_codon:yes stop_codon:yes gene_type:complete